MRFWHLAKVMDPEWTQQNTEFYIIDPRTYAAFKMGAHKKQLKYLKGLTLLSLPQKSLYFLWLRVML